MKNCATKSFSNFLIIFSLLIFCSCDASIEKYEHRNQAEKEIILVLIQYQDAKNRFDLKHLLSLLHEKGEFSFQCGLMVSKDRLKEMLPGFWDEIKSGNTAVIPLTHECINGDFFKSGQLNNPEIKINGDKAEATVVFTKGFSRVQQYFAMLHEKGRWLITRTEWGHS